MGVGAGRGARKAPAELIPKRCFISCPLEAGAVCLSLGVTVGHSKGREMEVEGMRRMMGWCSQDEISGTAAREGASARGGVLEGVDCLCRITRTADLAPLFAVMPRRM